MQNDLIMNHIPLPKYFDGDQWNTVVKPTRKSIPKYLHQDLPQLRHLYIKQIFKQMGKFSVPNLQFFNNMIKQKTNNKKQEKDKRSSSMMGGKKERGLEYNEVKEEFQYALMLMDRGSNVIDELVEKAQRVEPPHKKSSKLTSSSQPKSFRSRTTTKTSFTKENPKARFFDHTVDLVFRNRRNKYVENLKKSQEIDQVPESFEKRFEEMGLVDISNPYL